MELNDFINDVVNELTERVRIASEKMIIQDILMIFNDSYECYEKYVDEMIKANKRVNEFEKLGISFTVHPKHIIINKEIYNFIKDLRKVYK